MVASSHEIKAALAALVDKHGARRVAEELVEVFHDKAEAARVGQTLWLRIATRLGNTVHFTNLEWPT